MFLNHIGIVNKNEEQALRFYRDFLGLELTKDSVVPRELSQQLFSFSNDIKLLVFEKNNIKVDVFIHPEHRLPEPNFTHLGFILDNFEEILKKASQAGVELIVGTHKEKTVYFIKDFSGNFIEIKKGSTT
ncbi:MAG: VOC family protein [Thermodesulfovibrionia bacterium]|nr:VOC family protein [Thermodesulfovibrionia bacterium]